MKHPEGRILAIQQQMFFAEVLGEAMDVPTAIILRKLAMSGLSLVTDTQEIAVDASAVYPRVQETKLSVVKETL